MTASWEKGLAQVESGEIEKAVFRAKMEQYVKGYIETIRKEDRSSEIRRTIRENVPKG